MPWPPIHRPTKTIRHAIVMQNAARRNPTIHKLSELGTLNGSPPTSINVLSVAKEAKPKADQGTDVRLVRRLPPRHEPEDRAGRQRRTSHDIRKFGSRLSGLRFYVVQPWMPTRPRLTTDSLCQRAQRCATGPRTEGGK